MYVSAVLRVCTLTLVISFYIRIPVCSANTEVISVSPLFLTGTSNLLTIYYKIILKLFLILIWILEYIQCLFDITVKQSRIYRLKVIAIYSVVKYNNTECKPYLGSYIKVQEKLWPKLECVFICCNFIPLCQTTKSEWVFKQFKQIWINLLQAYEHLFLWKVSYYPTYFGVSIFWNELSANIFYLFDLAVTNKLRRIYCENRSVYCYYVSCDEIYCFKWVIITFCAHIHE